MYTHQAIYELCPNVVTIRDEVSSSGLLQAYDKDGKEVSYKPTEVETRAKLLGLRAERDRLIAETDWWASSDLTITDAQKKYRQDLRDITKTATSLDDVTWPTKP